MINKIVKVNKELLGEIKDNTNPLQIRDAIVKIEDDYTKGFLIAKFEDMLIENNGHIGDKFYKLVEDTLKKNEESKGKNLNNAVEKLLAAIEYLNLFLDVAGPESEDYYTVKRIVEKIESRLEDLKDIIRE